MIILLFTINTILHHGRDNNKPSETGWGILLRNTTLNYLKSLYDVKYLFGAAIPAVPQKSSMFIIRYETQSISGLLFIEPAE